MLWTVAAAVSNPLIFVAIISAINHLIVSPESSSNTTTSRTFITRKMSPTPTGGIHYLDDDAEVDDVRTQIAGSSLTLVLAVASFVPKCKSLLAAITSLVETEEKNEQEPPARPSPLVLVIQTDEADELEELAIEMGLNDVPSYQIYGSGGRLITSSDEGDAVTIEAIGNGLKMATVLSSGGTIGIGGCCPPGSNPAVCCPSGSGTDTAPSDPNDVRRLVQQSYAATVNNESGGCCVSVDPAKVGYTPEQILKAGKDANLGLGCGNPMGFANVTKGETVLDLGSGAGVDCFLAADEVGDGGFVIGVDMTPDMIHKARSNAVNRKTNNVEFRLGEIEYLPVADNTVDCVVSNCVINLSPDKPQVFREIYRILKKGGRVAVSDVVIRPQKIIPDRLKTAEALAC
jgi:2-polyprenyl-3-methyl-5-hydroxy-6-metoxy-1,4-benzoquinol methylase